MRKRELQRLRRGHIALWTWLAETGSVFKGNWPGWKWNGGKYKRVTNLCFCCKATPCCDKCMIKWNGKYCVISGNSEYERWLRTKDIKNRKRLAAKIATMWPEIK